MSIIVDNSKFQHYEAAEMWDIFNSTHYFFFGLRMQQTPQALRKLNQLLTFEKFDRIIEIGTGDGGLTYLFALYCKINNREFYSYDIHDKGHNIPLLQKSFNTFFIKDVIFDQANVDEVKLNIQKPGKTLLICDAGKSVEFNVYAESLKVGDFIMTHDFAPGPLEFKELQDKKIWNWHESDYDAIEQACIKNNIIHTSYFNDVAWSCGWRE